MARLEGMSTIRLLKIWNICTVAWVILLMAATEEVKASTPNLATDYNITLVTDSAPDLTDIDSYLYSITSQYNSPQEKAIAIWRWSQRLRKQTSNAMEDGHFVLDPITLFNSYGHCNCGIISGVNNALWLKMGWKAHYVQLGDHTVCECSWDNGKTWHMFDSSMSFYCFNDEGQVASVREIEKNPRFYLENYAPECGTNPVEGTNDHRGWRCASDGPARFNRTLANGYDSFKPPNDVTDGNLYAQWGRRYVLNLRPGEWYTRYFQPLDRGGLGTFRPVNGKDMDSNQNFLANGIWRYSPDLTNPATRELVYFEKGTRWTPKGVEGAGHVVFKITAANVVTSARFLLCGNGVTVSVSRCAGIEWEKVPVQTGSWVEFIAPVTGVTEYLVKVDLADSQSLLSSIVIETVTQLNRPALPRLSRGPNIVQVRLGRQVETLQFQPSVVGGRHKMTAYSEQGIDVDPEAAFYKPVLRSAEKGKPCNVTWKIETPTPILELIFGGTVCVKVPKDRVTLLHSWNDRDYFQDYAKTTDNTPYDFMVNTPVTNVPPDTRTAYLRYEFETARFPKHYFGPGIQAATMTVYHQPKVTNFAPVEVTYCWVEHHEKGDIERRHIEWATSPSYEYNINVAGFRDPTMKWIRLNLKGHGPDGDAVTVGYSDGKIDLKGDKAPWVRYQWGQNLERGKPYTIEGKQDAKNLDDGRDLTDGIIAPPDTYVSAKYMPTYVMFTPDTSPVVTLDIGTAQKISAVRVHSGQEGGFRLSHPDSITVEASSDGKTFSSVGSTSFNQIFEPPADFVPWELDESTLFNDLPAGGRLAYAYRIILDHPVIARFVRVRCAARKGWGMLLSEIQVFDSVRIDTTVPPLVTHRPIASQ